MHSCPSCGFDLDPKGRCAVCGYTPEQAVRELLGSTTRPPDAGVRANPSAGGRPRGLLDEAEEVPRAGFWNLGGRKRTPIFLLAFVLLAALAAFYELRGAAPARSAADRAMQPAAARAAAPPAPSIQPAGSLAANQPVAPLSAAGAADSSIASLERKDFGAPIGASPVAIRATHPIELYDPTSEPVFNLSRRTQLPPLTNEEAYVKWMVSHTGQKASFLRERWHRAQLAVERHLVVHKRVLTAFLLTPREWFVRSYNLPETYANTALPIGYGQTISGPDLVMHMTDALDPQPNQRVLEIGTGSGYQSAILAQLSNYVYTIEIVRPLAEQTNEIYLEHTKQMPEYANIHRRLADGYYGWPAYAPFDRIIVTTGIDHIPPDLLKELKPGGIMVIPIGPPTGQTILKITKTVDSRGRVHLTRTNLYPGVTDIFVPFTAAGGGTHDLGAAAP